MSEEAIFKVAEEMYIKQDELKQEIEQLKNMIIENQQITNLILKILKQYNNNKIT